MISFTTKTYDLQGELVLRKLAPKTTRFRDRERRVTRTATLDGLAVITDGGYSPSDRTVTAVVVSAPDAIIERAQYLVQNYSELWISIPDGGFNSVISNISVSDGSELRITVLLLGPA